MYLTRTHGCPRFVLRSGTPRGLTILYQGREFLESFCLSIQVLIDFFVHSFVTWDSLHFPTQSLPYYKLERDQIFLLILNKFEKLTDFPLTVSIMFLLSISLILYQWQKYLSSPTLSFPCKVRLLGRTRFRTVVPCVTSDPICFPSVLLTVLLIDFWSDPS